MYGYLGTMRAKPSHRDEVVAILLRGPGDVGPAGCQQYLIGVSDSDPDLIFVTEIWQSKEHHDASLQLAEVRAAIAVAMPLLTGDFTGQELTVVGGLGLWSSRTKSPSTEL
jgi:quinol monooxygenase YgiN